MISIYYFFLSTMSLFNENLKNISIVEILALFIILFGIMFSFNFLNIPFSSAYAYLIIISYFVFKLRNSYSEFKLDVKNIFSEVSFNTVLIIVLLNIFFSYGMLYFSNYLLHIVNANNYFGFFSLMSVTNVLSGYLGFLSVVLLSPIGEELLFRGIFLNKLKIIVPTTFAILISSLLFASLHSFGSIFSAFIFAICMAILYLKSENILVPIFGHFLNNLIGETIYHADSFQILFNNGLIVGVMSLLAIVSLILLLKFIISNWNNI